MKHRLPLILLCVISVSCFFSCMGTAPTKEIRLVDSLNRQAYFYHYRNLDSLYNVAQKAYQSAQLYHLGKAEACNNLAFYSFMKMDFDKAEHLNQEVYDLTKNELELLIADIGLMKIYQRTAMNKEFYDYRNSALKRMKRIDEDKNLFVDRHEIARLKYAYSEFYIVSAIYYYYLQQQQEAYYAINQIDPLTDLAGDNNQLLYYHYIKGAASLCDGETAEVKRLHEFDELYTSWRLAVKEKSIYFEANGIQGMANLMANPDNYEFLKNRRSHALKQLGLPVDSLLPLKMAQISLDKFRRYNDLYQTAAAYVTIGRFLNTHNRYQEAVDTLSKALDCVNKHHELYYNRHHQSNQIDRLDPFVDKDTLYTELSWLSKKKVKTVPEWISRIREQLSVSYAGLGMKIPSDYNRNVYLDILEYTRQDKQFESRYASLEKESAQLNVIMLLVLAGLFLVVGLFAIFNSRSRNRNLMHLARLKLTLDICQKITASIPSDVTDEDDIVEAISEAILPDLQELLGATSIKVQLMGEEESAEEEAHEEQSLICSAFPLHVPDKEEPIGIVTITTKHKLSKDELALVSVITPYIAWTLDNGITFISLGEEQRQLEKQRYVYEQHIATNKRQNMIKKSCLAIVNGITPYIDRIINEVHKLTEKGFMHDAEIKRRKYEYVDELVTTINEYNDILALWIKLKQGSLSLNIENFELDELFSIVAKGRKTFEMKKQHFEVLPARVTVKADKALTLFMINTLTENARKYTPQEGSIQVFATITGEYVEISIKDNGRGLTEADVQRILGEKVYDSKAIGIDNASSDVEELKQNKGSGFGLMNCKGIIEKYRKTNDVFKVCLFSVESEPGKGSRFFFRLPLGIRKIVGVLLLFLSSFAFVACGPDKAPVNKVTSRYRLERKVEIPVQQDYEELLNEASLFADTAYYCNVIEDYKLALQYVDSAMNRLNRHYAKYSRFPRRYIKLYDTKSPAEIEWWNTYFDSDFHVILDIRNEASVSLLALKRWNEYTYNNAAYTALYKLLGEDQSLEEYCRQLERSTTNKYVGVILCLFLLASLLIGYYIIYVRKRLINRLNLEQVLEINKTVFAASLLRSQESSEVLLREEETLKEIPQRIVDDAFSAVNELMTVNGMGIAVYNETAHRLEYAANPRVEEIPAVVHRCFEQQAALQDEQIQALPLIVDVGGQRQCVGVLTLLIQEPERQEADFVLVELIARYVAIVVFNAVVKLAMRYRDIESAHEEARRASWEDNQLHVQNMVLDNCLSTIKHETIYYPNKIKQIIDKLNTQTLNSEEEKEGVETITELIDYYKSIFTVLSQCASRQLEEVTFRRTTITVEELFQHAEKYFRRLTKNQSVKLKLHTEVLHARVTGDKHLLCFLLENLIDEAFSVPEDGILHLKAVGDGDYIRFLFTDSRREKTVEELNQLFYPNLLRMTAAGKGELVGTEYLVCKQIVRDHDEFAIRRGCRINAEPCAEGGFTVYFTIPGKIIK